MKVRLLNDAGYEGLANVQFPVEVEVERQGWSLYYVSYDAIAAIPGWFYHTDDVHEGSPYCFYKDEVEVVVNPKIRVHSPSGYSSLMNLDFPMVLEAHRIEEDGAAFVKASVLRAWGVETDDGDFVFLEEEYTLVEEKKSLYDCFGANPSPEALAANQRAADLSMQDMITVSGTFVQNVADAGRKDQLLKLIEAHVDAVQLVDVEAEYGLRKDWEAAKERRDSLMQQIKEMIQEGV